MTWVDLVGNADFLRKLFPEAPSLQCVRVFEVGLHQDGPRVMIRFDLNEFPKEAPAKWRQAGANKVQIRLMCVGVRALEVRGWTTNNIADLTLEPDVSVGLRLIAQADGFLLRGGFEHILLDGISAYHDAA